MPTASVATAPHRIGVNPTSARPRPATVDTTASALRPSPGTGRSAVATSAAPSRTWCTATVGAWPSSESPRRGAGAAWAARAAARASGARHSPPSPPLRSARPAHRTPGRRARRWRSDGRERPVRGRAPRPSTATTSWTISVGHGDREPCPGVGAGVVVGVGRHHEAARPVGFHRQVGIAGRDGADRIVDDPDFEQGQVELDDVAAGDRHRADRLGLPLVADFAQDREDAGEGDDSQQRTQAARPEGRRPSLLAVDERRWRTRALVVDGWGALDGSRAPRSSVDPARAPRRSHWSRRAVEAAAARSIMGSKAPAIALRTTSGDPRRG